MPRRTGHGPQSRLSVWHSSLGCIILPGRDDLCSPDLDRGPTSHDGPPLLRNDGHPSVQRFVAEGCWSDQWPAAWCFRGIERSSQLVHQFMTRERDLGGSFRCFAAADSNLSLPICLTGVVRVVDGTARTIGGGGGGTSARVDASIQLKGWLLASRSAPLGREA